MEGERMRSLSLFGTRERRNSVPPTTEGSEEEEFEGVEAGASVIGDSRVDHSSFPRCRIIYLHVKQLHIDSERWDYLENGRLLRGKKKRGMKCTNRRTAWKH
jgi:hypothetical protein